MKVIPHLQHIKLKDGSYAILLPINTADQVLIDIKNKITLRTVLGGKLDKAGGDLTGPLSHSLTDKVKKYTDLYATMIEGEVTGAIKITLPKGYLNNTVTIKVSGMSISATSSWSVIGSCYANRETGQPEFCSARIDGKGPFKEARFADDGENLCLIIGSDDSTWKDTQIFIDSVIVANNEIDGWETGYNVEVIPALTSVSNVTPCINIGGGRIEICHGTITLDETKRAIDFMQGEIREYDEEFDTLNVHINGLLLTEGIHYEIDGHTIVPKEGYSFEANEDEPITFSFELIKNSKPN